MEFPISVDFEVYRNHQDNQDLVHLFESELHAHYNNHGKQEGRTASYITSMESFLEIIKVNDFSTLQISDSDKSMIPKFEMDLAKIKQQDNARPYLADKEGKEIKPESFKKYQAILSVNSLEYQIDLISYLQLVSDLLKDGGYFFGRLPNKKYTKYHFVNETDISDIVKHHFSWKTSHYLQTIVKEKSFVCHDDSKRHWNNDHGFPKIMENSSVVSQCIDEYRKSQNNSSFREYVCNYFTADSFQEIIELLYDLKFIDFKVSRVYQTTWGKNDFYFILSKETNEKVEEDKEETTDTYQNTNIEDEESKVSSEITGSTSPTGPTGTSEITESSSSTGSTESTGPTGSSGTSGSSGHTGESGITGSSGPSGITGSSGPSGITGSSGSSGITGSSGPSGITGSTETNV